MEVWESVLSCIEKRVSHQNFDIWFKPTVLKREDLGKKRLFVQVPNKHFKYWLAENYSEVIQASLAELKLEDFRVSFVADDDSGKQRVNDTRLAAALQEPCPDAAQCRLNDKYTFSRFVVGFCNKFAHLAAVAVAEQPAKAYNPFFIYGAVGLGKTHLMHAIANELRRNFPERKVVYLSAERFMYQFITALRYKDTVAFKKQFRSVDLLMIDDVQFIGNKNTTQEEFFHTFNALVDNRRQVVISADRSPTDLTGIEERIISRLGWGLVADIYPTDYELRLGILQSKSESIEGVTVPEDVLEFLAKRITSNVRELEGALNRVVAYSTLAGRPISLDMTQDILQDLLRANDRKVTIDEIQRQVADYYNLRLAELLSSRRARNIARPRQVAMYLSKQMTARSLPEIGRKFGGRDHTTVMHAVRKVDDLRRTDSTLDEDIIRLARLLDG